MSLAKRLCAAQTRLLRAGENHPNLGIFKAYIVLLHIFYYCHGDKAAREVVISAHDGTLLVFKEKSRKENGYPREENISHDVESAAVCRRKGVTHRNRPDAEHKSEQDADKTQADYRHEQLRAAVIGESPLVGAVRVAGENYAALDLALGLSDGDDVMRRLFGEEGVGAASCRAGTRQLQK